jgi:hypothetical protein
MKTFPIIQVAPAPTAGDTGPVRRDHFDSVSAQFLVERLDWFDRDVPGERTIV